MQTFSGPNYIGHAWVPALRVDLIPMDEEHALLTVWPHGRAYPVGKVARAEFCPVLPRGNCCPTDETLPWL